MTREVLKLALEALDQSVDTYFDKRDAAILAIKAALAQPEQVTSDRMAYEGAREDLLVCKCRALQAEALNKKFATEVNGQAFMGEPEQEPVAWPTMPPSIGQSPVLFESGYDEGWAKCMSMCKAAMTAPPKRQPLTEKEIEAVYEDASGQSLRPQDYRIVLQFARAIEAAHDIGDKT